jgi:hypothetical protein
LPSFKSHGMGHGFFLRIIPSHPIPRGVLLVRMFLLEKSKFDPSIDMFFTETFICRELLTLSIIYNLSTVIMYHFVELMYESDR